MKAGETFFFDPYLYTACTMLTFTFVQSIYLCNNIRIRSCIFPLLLPSLHPSFSYNSPFRYGIHSSLADFTSIPNSSSPTFFYRSWKIKHYMSYLPFAASSDQLSSGQKTEPQDQLLLERGPGPEQSCPRLCQQCVGP